MARQLTALNPRALPRRQLQRPPGVLGVFQFGFREAQERPASGRRKTGGWLDSLKKLFS